MVQIPAFAMSIGTIAMPKMFHENFGEQECYGYHHMNVAFLFWGVISGFTMALYRLTCIKGKRYQVNYFIGLAFGLLILLFTNQIDPKTLPAYRFCMGQEAPKTAAGSNVSESFLDKILAARVILISQALILLEFAIYIYVLKDQQKHNEKHLEEKIINKMTFKVRKEKNVITLNGQLCIFVIRMFLSMLILISRILGIKLFDYTVYYPVAMIPSQFVQTLAQVLSSHELRRYVKSKFD